MLLAEDACARQLQLSGPQQTVKEGYFTVTVTVRGGNGSSASPGLIIEAAQDPKFSENVRRFPALNDFQQLSLSGFSNGTYFLRATAEPVEQPSNVIKVTVQHYPLWQALGLFTVGLLMFVALVVTIIRSHIQHQHKAATSREAS
ncbi:MAG: hypothetical protein ACQEQZ_01145 [Pseudomonadota bacterium]